jgi:hypothetical protein
MWDVDILVALVTQLRLATQQHLRPRHAQRPLRGDFDVRQHIRCAKWRVRRFEYRHSCRYGGMHHHLWYYNHDLLVMEAEPCQASTSTGDGTKEKWRPGRGNGRGPILLAQWQWLSGFYCTRPR